MQKKLPFVAYLILIILAWPPNATFAQNASFMISAKSGQLNTARASAEAIGGEVIRTFPQLNVLVVETDNGNFSKEIGSRAGINFFTTNPMISWHEPTEVVELESFGNPPTSGDDDFFFDLQWGHDAVDAPEAWDNGYRGQGVYVAVLDSGIDCGHADITPNLVHSKSASFVPGEGYCVADGFFFNHGTHVAGTVLAADNGYGTIGVAPKARLIAVKVLSEFTGSGSFDWLISGIVHATDNGADIVNMSLGALIPKVGQLDAAQKELKAMIDLASNYAHSKGVFLVAAAGNDATDLRSGFTHLPSDAEWMMSISATRPIGWAIDPSTDLDLPATYSNYGQNKIDFAGPGGDADFTVPGTCVVASISRSCWVFDLVFSTIAGGWGWAAGTSMAAPHVSGVAAILKSQYPWASPLQLRNFLKSRADKLGSNPGHDAFYGWGRVDAINGATGETADGRDDLLEIAGETPEDYSLAPNYPNPFNPTTSIIFELPEQVHARLAVYDLLGREVDVLVNGSMAAGQHEVKFSAANLPSGTYFYKLEAGSFVELRRMLLLK